MKKNPPPTRHLVLALGMCIVLVGTVGTAGADDAARCASSLQSAYGKYFACALKLHSRASKQGDFTGDVDFTSCEVRLDKIVGKTFARYGSACPEFSSSEIVEFADQCVGDTASASAGMLPAAALTTVAEACTGPVALDRSKGRCLPLAEVFAAHPPKIDSIDISPNAPAGTSAGHVLPTASVRVTFARTELKRLPPSLEIDVGERKPVILEASATDQAVYTGTIPWDSKVWSEYSAALEQSEAVAQGRDTPVFEGRVLAGEGPASGGFFSEFLAPGGSTSSVPVLPVISPATVDPDLTLMITDVNVVEDPDRTFDPCTPSTGTAMGKWTFGRLMEEMANPSATGLDPSAFTLDLLENWLVDQTVNGLSIPARTAMQSVIDRWQLASGGAGVPLDLSIAPFRLMAIVNRVDLRGNSPYGGGGGGDCGEGRFVFGLLNTDTCDPLRFGVILEYKVNLPGCKPCRKYARKWLDLQDPTLGGPGDPLYNDELENLTDIFSLGGTTPGNPNGSSLGQLRTNENALASQWELREFVLSPATGLLVPDTTKQNPHMPLNFTTDLENWVNPNAPIICANDFTVPDEHPVGAPFLAASVPYGSASFFDGVSSATLPDRCARFELSLNSCAGCHARETDTSFCHVGDGCTRPIGSPALLSGFLTGNTVIDPADGTPTRTFNDLARRQSDLWLAAHIPCFPRLALPVLAAEH
ncbi:MAG: hypothetical protein P8R42_23070 [Candidatus Binatia bacterium]|nr:hypothetical protein [Candidatus Binatia bacterium]